MLSVSDGWGWELPLVIWGYPVSGTVADLCERSRAVPVKTNESMPWSAGTALRDLDPDCSACRRTRASSWLRLATASSRSQLYGPDSP
jgi:hypothetical protein